MAVPPGHHLGSTRAPHAARTLVRQGSCHCARAHQTANFIVCPPASGRAPCRFALAGGGGTGMSVERLGLSVIPGAGWRASDIRDVAKAAEQAGFEAIFTTEANNDALATAQLMGSATGTHPGRHVDREHLPAALLYP